MADLDWIYTSRWQNKRLADLDVVPVGISRGTPRFKLPYRYRLLRMLAPTHETFGIEDEEEFRRAYVGHLEELGVAYIGNWLERISYEHGGMPLVLLCYENTHAGEVCHRRMFAEWWTKRTGETVAELDDSVEAKRRALIQEKLFETKEVRKGD
jgi:hypothetical protein